MISKGMHKRYAKLVVEKYPSLKISDFEEDFVSLNVTRRMRRRRNIAS
jgi:ribosomal protein S17E